MMVPTADDSAAEAEATELAKKEKSEALRPFVIISSSYLLFTVTDGAVRMVVLLHANALGFTALEVAAMFSLYELAGVVTNLAAGIAGDRYGIRATLLAGLLLQLCGLGMLAGWSAGFSRRTAIAYVTLAQMLCGVAKDLTKLGGKAVTKLVTPEEKQTSLFKLVSMLTGLKNSLKGVGYFVGAALLDTSADFGYELTLGVLAALILAALPFPLTALSPVLGRGGGAAGTADGSKRKQAPTLREALSTKNRNLNVLSLARTFLFASRDFWFEVPLPFFLRAPACAGLGEQRCAAEADVCARGAVCAAASGVCENPNPGGGCGGLGLPRVSVGTFLALYIIFYGQVQSWTPQLVSSPLRQQPPNALVGALWACINIVPTALLAGLAWSAPYFVAHGGYGAAHSDGRAADAESDGVLVTLAVCVVAFAFVFGVNSSVHSYLVVRYAKEDKVAKSLGFYYMSNAAGRFLGTVGSGLLYTYAGEYVGAAAGTDATRGLAACFVAGSLSSVLAAVIPLRIDDGEAGLRCGSLCVCVEPSPPAAGGEAAPATGAAAVAAAATAAPISAQPGQLEVALRQRSDPDATA